MEMMGKRVVSPPQAVMFATLFWQSLHSVRPSPLSHGPNTRFTIISVGYLWHAPLFTCLLFLPCTSSCRVVILLHIEKKFDCGTGDQSTKLARRTCCRSYSESQSGFFLIGQFVQVIV